MVGGDLACKNLRRKGKKWERRTKDRGERGRGRRGFWIQRWGRRLFPSSGELGAGEEFWGEKLFQKGETVMGTACALLLVFLYLSSSVFGSTLLFVSGWQNLCKAIPFFLIGKYYKKISRDL